ncbi:MAG: DNA polymerase IV [Actinomycetota bacterium]|nr:DNA polymerase IV [Actinomycetota bacterium]
MAPGPATFSEPILHVDMDAFYASVEEIKDPSLKGLPVVVGGQGGRGVVTSASYEARKYGVRSAMPIVTARRLCPHATFLPNDFKSYGEYSIKIKEVFTSFTPLVEPLSLDEAFLDVSGSVRIFGSPVDIALQIKRKVAELGLTCTVGVAPNKFLAKLASTRGKPDGLLVVRADEVIAFLHPLPVTALWGVGPQTAVTLERLGLKTVGDLAAISQRTLARAVGEALGAHLHHLARGIDDREVVPNDPARSVGSEETFSYDLDSPAEIAREILRLADRTAERLRAKGLCGRTVTLKVRFSNFSTLTRSKTLPAEVDTTPAIYQVARALFDKLDHDRLRIRLLGVSVTGLATGPPNRQLELVPDGELSTATHQRWDDAAGAMDSIRRRFGSDSVGPAALLDHIDGDAR